MLQVRGVVAHVTTTLQVRETVVCIVAGLQLMSRRHCNSRRGSVATCVAVALELVSS